MNLAYEWIKQWTDSGKWYRESNKNVWALLIEYGSAGKYDYEFFRDDMKRLIDAAEKGGINEPRL